MRKIVLLISLTLTTAYSLSAQSLYQDAITLANILKKERYRTSASLDAEPPMLVLMKERDSVLCVFSEDAPSTTAGRQADLMVPISKETLARAARIVLEKKLKKLGIKTKVDQTEIELPIQSSLESTNYKIMNPQHIEQIAAAAIQNRLDSEVLKEGRAARRQ